MNELLCLCSCVITKKCFSSFACLFHVISLNEHSLSLIHTKDFRRHGLFQKSFKVVLLRQVIIALLGLYLLHFHLFVVDWYFLLDIMEKIQSQVKDSSIEL